MIDLHTHILPGLDDGSPSLAYSVEMARRAVEAGIEVVAATPHANNWSDRWSEQAYQDALAGLRRALVEHAIPLQVVAGCEAMAEPGLAAKVGQGQVRPIHVSRYLLFELSFQIYPTYVEHVVFELQLAGYVPVLAHPERYQAIQENPNLVIPLIERGVLMQINVGSVAGDFGSRVRETAEILIRHEMGHLLASDAHEASHFSSWAQACDQVNRWAESDIADALTRREPAAIIANEAIVPPAPRPYRRRRIWALWQ
jgi:protein-tyrosine phosphatase